MTDMEDMEGMDMGDKMNATDGESGAKCNKECRKQAKKDAKKAAKKAEKNGKNGGVGEEEDEDMLDFGVEFVSLIHLLSLSIFVTFYIH